ncbi:MAG: anaerobic ribonucleoside-triphosphate reductase activating protein [Lachnospiraceae bacterium]|nr:anaerobic ribonucleoside-triphosphate reductase activating protein [Lachnospiraceae bacterium]
MLNIIGLQKTTLLDYPGHVAATVFLAGCNMRCPFCHNMNIVTSQERGSYTDEDILKFLSKRSGVLDGVCITGGEPTLYDELPAFLRLIKGMGLLTKLDTNGTNPKMLKFLIDECLVDYIAMDIKSSLSEYGKACGVEDIKLAPIKESIDILIGGNCEYEFRTTAVKEFLDPGTVKDISVLLKGAKRYYLQGFVMSEFVPDKTLNAIDREELLMYRQELSSSIECVELRGIQ